MEERLVAFKARMADLEGENKALKDEIRDLKIRTADAEHTIVNLSSATLGT